MSSRLKQNLPAVMLFVFFASLYIYTAAPGVYDGDSGEIAAAVNTLGLAHPTGFPLYMLLGKLFTLSVPIGDIAYRLNIFSALLTAGALVFVYYTLKNLGRSTFASLAASVVLGLGTNTIWANSGRVGVYPLSLLFVSILFFIFSKWGRKPDTKHLYSYGLLWGLSLGTHALILIMSAPLILMLWQARSFLRSHISILIKVFIITSIGWLQYIYLLFAFRRNGIINWGDMSDFNGFLYYITQRQYAGKIFANNFSNFFSKLANLLSSEFTLLFFLIAIAGLVYLYKKNRGLSKLLIIIMLINVGVTYAYGKNEDDLKILYRYLFIVDTVLAIGVAYGLDAIMKWKRYNTHRKFIIPITVALLFFLFNYSHADNNRRSNFLIGDTAKNALITSQPNSIILALGDHVVGPLWYLQSIGERKDVIIVSTALLSYDWYVNNMISKYPDVISRDLLSIKSGNDRILELIQQNITKRPVYSIMFNALGNDKKFDFVPQGILFRIIPKGSDTKEIMINNKTIWDKYTLRNVKSGFYSDAMLNDLTISYSFSLYVAGVEYFKNGFIDESIDFLQWSNEVHSTTDAQENLDFVKNYKNK